MSRSYDVVCFAPNDWWGMNPSCTTHYMLRFARERKVLFINPFSSDLGGIRHGIVKRVARKLKSLSRFLRNPVDQLYVYSPLFLPFHGNPRLDAWNNRFLKWQIYAVCRYLKIRLPVIWVENPRAADLLEAFQYQKIVYHVSDHFAKSRYIKNKEVLEKRENSVTQKSDLVIAVSRQLYELKKNHKNVKYMPHGVDFELFRDASLCPQVPEELKTVPRPVIGYYGTLSSSNDVELWTYCARQLKTFSFVFAGQVTGGDYSELSSMPNVHFLGKLPYEKIPILCSCFDVCMLQWRMTEWIAACNPLKTMEYMASGKPIVSVPIQYIVDNYNELISIAQNKEEFCAAIQWELQNDTPDRSARRIEIAGQHSWESHYRIIKHWIDELLEEKK